MSAFITPYGPPARVVESWRMDRFVVVVSQPILDEIRDVLMRPRIQRKYRYTSQQVDSLIDEIVRKAQHVVITNALRVCRDPQDDAILETAILGRASHAVSRDEDITRDTNLRDKLREYNVAPITVRRFIELLTQPETDENS